MLQSIRSRITGVLALVILGLIALSFVFFGVATPSGGQGLSYAAKVNGSEVPLNNLRSELQRIESQQAQFYPDGIPEEQRAQLRERILDGLIRRELVNQRVYDDRYRTSDEALYKEIKLIPQFQLNGVFDRDVYEQQLRIAGRSPGQFERETKASLSVGQLSSAISNSAFITEAELARRHALENEQRSVSYTIIPASKFKSQVTVSEEDIAAEYEKAKDTLLTNEQVDIEYIELTAADLATKLEVTAEELSKYYDEVKFRYGSPEERAVSHIFLEYDAATLSEQEALANELITKLKNGADFGELAKANSDDIISANDNGNLGLVSNDENLLGKEFAAGLFAMTVGGDPKLIKADSGFHIVKLNEIKESSAPSFAELSVEQNIELENEYRNLQVEGILAEKADALAQEVFDARDNLAAVAQANGLQLKTQKNVERRTYSGIASNQVIKNAAFSDELRDGTNSDLLAVTTEQAVFLRVVEYRDVRQKTLDEVKVGLRTALEQKTASAKAAELGLALQTEITTEEELKNKSEAAAYNFTSNTVMTRSQAGLQRDLLTAIFQAEKPAANAIVEQGVQINNGDYAVFLITEVKQADITALSESEKMANIRALADQSGFSEFNAYVSSLREKASIEIPKVKEEVLN